MQGNLGIGAGTSSAYLSELNQRVVTKKRTEAMTLPELRLYGAELETDMQEIMTTIKEDKTLSANDILTLKDKITELIELHNKARADARQLMYEQSGNSTHASTLTPDYENGCFSMKFTIG